MTKLIGGRYRLESLLAEGGMGEVWRAHDELLGRDVAVKVLRKALISDPVVAERFRREARAAASLSHSNMANVYDYIEDDAHPGIVMELVEGETLGDIIAREAPMDLQSAATIIDQVLVALEVAHASGVVHRDIKPANVMLNERGVVKVADFGIARAMGESTLTETGTVLGSVHYVSPEQLHGGTLQAGSDLYATGVILYEMLTGSRPFEGETPIAVAMARLSNDPLPPRTHRADLPQVVEDVILLSLARDPVARYSTATEMRTALAEAVRKANEDIATMPMAAAGTVSPPTMRLPVMPAPSPTTRLPAQDDVATTMLRPASSPAPPRPDKKRVGVFRPALLGLALVLLLVALVALALRPAAKVAVPQFKGLQIAKAQALAEQKGLKIVIDESVYNSAAKGTVLQQTTDAKAIVAEGATVHVVTSKGPPPCCTVPRVTGLERDEAVDRIERAGLTAGISFRETSEEDAGTVLEQSPDAGRTLARGSKVGIVVATEPDGKGRGKGRG